MLLLSRYGLPLLAVVVAHGVLLVVLGRGLQAPPLPPEPLALPVELLGPPSDVVEEVAAGAAAAMPDAATPAEPPPPLPAQDTLPLSEPPPVAEAPVPLPAPGAAGLPAPGGSLAAPTADVVPAAALDDPLAPPGAGGGQPGAPRSTLRDVAARLAPGTPEPAYPEEARRHQEEGSVTLQLKVGADGRVLAVKVLRSSGYPRLDRVARDVAWRWRLLPAEREGRPVESFFEKTLNFRLED
jgi:protein TonB